MEKVVRYRIAKIGLPEYSLNEKPNYSITGDDCEVTMNLGIATLREEQQLRIDLRARYIDKRTQEELSDFKVDFYFSILDFENTFSYMNDRVNIPDGLLLDAMSITIGTARGMLVIRNEETYLSEIYLPIYNVLDLLSLIKAQQSPIAGS